MDFLQDLTQLHSLINSAQTIFIFLPKELEEDRLAAALSLYLSLKKNKKEVSLISYSPITVGFSHLVGVDKIKNKPEGRGLIISLPKKIIEKVSYNEGEETFDLIIRPKEGYPPLKPEELNFSSTDVEADLILLMDVNNIDELEEISQNYSQLFKKENVKSLRLKDFSYSCWSSLITKFIALYNLPIDEDIATNLLYGLEKGTENFGLKAGVDAFEAAVFCLKNGGRRGGRREEKEEKVIEEKKKEEQIPSDWFTPKIYKGNGSI
ncbi:MAG: hypothetical protein ACPLKP_02465 [Microgenomates group bacterium]